MDADKVLISLLWAAAIVVGLHAFQRSKRLVTRLLCIPAAILLLLFWPPAERMLVGFLESGYQQGYPRDQNVQAIVVLSATVYPPEPERPVWLVGENTYERTFYAAWLYHHWHPLPILACGGPEGDRTSNNPAYAEVMRDLLLKTGVPAGMLWVERESTNTYENARNAARILRENGVDRIALVTEAYHMRRAEGCFRKQGIRVVPAPCGFRSRYPLWWWRWFPSHLTFAQAVDAMHEFIGLGWYLVRNRI